MDLIIAVIALVFIWQEYFFAKMELLLNVS